MADDTKPGWRGIPLSLVTWFAAGVGLTLGYRFMLWLLGVLHLG